MGKKLLWELKASEQLKEFASYWLMELEEGSASDDYGRAVIWMGFTAPLEQQWDFLLHAVALASTDEQLEGIAAGPVEQLLSKFGESCIVDFESQFHLNHVFARMLTGAQQHLMTDNVWKRISSLQQLVTNPLKKDCGPA